METDGVVTQHVICVLPLTYKQNKRSITVHRVIRMCYQSPGSTHLMQIHANINSNGC